MQKNECLGVPSHVPTFLDDALWTIRGQRPWTEAVPKAPGANLMINNDADKRCIATASGSSFNGDHKVSQAHITRVDTFRAKDPLGFEVIDFCEPPFLAVAAHAVGSPVRAQGIGPVRKHKHDKVCAISGEIESVIDTDEQLALHPLGR